MVRLAAVQPSTFAIDLISETLNDESPPDFSRRSSVPRAMPASVATLSTDLLAARIASETFWATAAEYWMLSMRATVLTKRAARKPAPRPISALTLPYSGRMVPTWT